LTFATGVIDTGSECLLSCKCLRAFSNKKISPLEKSEATGMKKPDAKNLVGLPLYIPFKTAEGIENINDK
jgi:hypothetical protein